MIRSLPAAAVREARLATLVSLLLIGCGPAVGTSGPIATPSGAAAATPTVGPVSPSPTPIPEPDWRATIVGDAPLLDSSAIDGVDHLLAGALLLEAGTVHGWVIGFGTAVGDQAPYHVTWEVGTDTIATIEPVDIDPGIRLTNPGAIPQSIIRLADGSFTMYGWGTIAAQARAPVFWRASAATPAGPWTADPGVVFLAASASAWDSARIDFPTVLSSPSAGYVMVYEGASTATPDSSHIGFARSRDGVSWTHDAVPVLSPGTCGNGDDASIFGPRAMALEDGLVVAYLGNDGRETAGVYLAEAQPDGSWGCQAPRRSCPSAHSRTQVASIRSRPSRTRAFPISPSKS
jgi:hypothetical protein